MSIQTFLEKQGWELVDRKGWTAVKDHRPAFRAAFNTDRVGKIIDQTFYVTLSQLDMVTVELTRQMDREPKSIRSRDNDRNVTYWGFDTSGVSDRVLGAFVGSLAAAIDDTL